MEILQFFRDLKTSKKLSGPERKVLNQNNNFSGLYKDLKQNQELFRSYKEIFRHKKRFLKKY